MAHSQSIIEVLVQLKDEISGGFGKIFESMNGVLGAAHLFEGIIIGWVTGEVMKALEAVVGAFGEMEMTLVRLNAGLRATGRYSAEGSDAIQKMAATMEHLTTHSRESALGVSTLMAAFTKGLSAEQMAEMQKAAIAMSDTFGMSIERASMMLSRGLEGNGMMLKRYGVHIDAAATEQERFHAVMARFGPLFDISVAAADTLTGRIEQSKNAFHELLITVGEIIATSLGLKSGATTIRDFLENLNTKIKEHEASWLHWGGVVKEILFALWETAKYVFFGFVDGFKIIWAGLKEGMNIIADVIVVFYNFGQIIGDAFNYGILWIQSHATDLVNWLIDKINDLILMMPAKLRSFLDISPIAHVVNGATELLSEAKQHMTDDANAAAAAIDDMASSSVKTLATINNAITDLNNHAITFAEAWQRVIAAANAPPPKLPDTKHEGGGANKDQAAPEVSTTTAVKNLLEAEKLLDAQYKAGLIGVVAYHAEQRKLREHAREMITTLQEQLKTLDPTSQQYQLQLKLLTELLGAYGKLGGGVKSIKEILKETFLGDGAPLKEANKDLTTLVDGFEKGMVDGIAKAITAHGNMGKAIEKAIGQAAAAQAKFAIGRALMFTAEGLAALVLDPAGAGDYFAAAAEMAIAAAAMGAIAGVTGGFSGGGGGKSGAQQTTQNVSQLADSGINIYLPSGFTNSQAFLNELQSSLEQLGDRRVSVRPVP